MKLTDVIHVSGFTGFLLTQEPLGKHLLSWTIFSAMRLTVSFTVNSAEDFNFINSNSTFSATFSVDSSLVVGSKSVTCTSTTASLMEATSEISKRRQQSLVNMFGKVLFKSALIINLRGRMASSI